MMFAIGGCVCHSMPCWVAVCSAYSMSASHTLLAVSLTLDSADNGHGCNRMHDLEARSSLDDNHSAGF